MNWKRILTGTLCAAIVLAAFNISGLLILQKRGALGIELMGMWGRMVAFNALPLLIDGFVLCWLYVLARPRLGPGPKTALLMSTVAFVLANGQLANPAFWMRSAALAAGQLGFNWVKFACATYLAGWQYIEKAP